MFPPQELVFLKMAHDCAGSRGLNIHAHTETQIPLTCSILTYTLTCNVYLDCVRVLCREKMPFHHVRAGLLYPDNYLSSSLTDGSEAFQLTSISTEELGGKCAFRARKRGWEVVGAQSKVWGTSNKCFTTGTMLFTTPQFSQGKIFPFLAILSEFEWIQWFPNMLLRK